MDRFIRGTKRRCGHCGAPFYDLNRTPVVCPKCHNEYVGPARVPTRALRPLPPVERVPAEAEEADHFEEDEAVTDEGEEESILPEENSDEDIDDRGMRD